MKINLPLLTVVYGLLASVALAQAPGRLSQGFKGRVK